MLAGQRGGIRASELLSTASVPLRWRRFETKKWRSRYVARFMCLRFVIAVVFDRVGVALPRKFVVHTFGADRNEHVFRSLARVFRMPAQTNGGREYEFVIARRPC